MTRRTKELIRMDRVTINLRQDTIVLICEPSTGHIGLSITKKYPHPADGQIDQIKTAFSYSEIREFIAILKSLLGDDE